MHLVYRVYITWHLMTLTFSKCANVWFEFQQQTASAHLIRFSGPVFDKRIVALNIHDGICNSILWTDFRYGKIDTIVLRIRNLSMVWERYRWEWHSMIIVTLHTWIQHIKTTYWYKFTASFYAQNQNVSNLLIPHIANDKLLECFMLAYGACMCYTFSLYIQTQIETLQF